MKTQHMVWKTTAVFACLTILAAALAGCGGAQTPTTQPPVIDPQATFAVIQTEAAATVVAGLTQNAPTAAPVVPTETLAPSATAAPTDTAVPTLAQPTAAPTAVPALPTATRPAATAAPLPTATLASLNCTVTEQGPQFGDDFPAGSDFDGRWVIKNNGTDTWGTGDVDVRYLSGTKLHTGPDIFDLPASIAPGSSYTLILDMKAPADAGRFTDTWILQRGGTTICAMSVTIDSTK